MALMWFSKDGLRPHTQRGPGTQLSVDEITSIFPKEHLRYAGTEAPSINPDKPSHSERNVVLELQEEDHVHPRLPERGFYLVVGLRPWQAEERLRTLRQPH